MCGRKTQALWAREISNAVPYEIDPATRLALTDPIGPGRTEAGLTDPDLTDPDLSDPDRTGLDRTGPDRTGPDLSDFVRVAYREAGDDIGPMHPFAAAEHSLLMPRSLDPDPARRELAS